MAAKFPRHVLYGLDLYQGTNTMYTVPILQSGHPKDNNVYPRKCHWFLDRGIHAQDRYAAMPSTSLLGRGFIVSDNGNYKH